MSRAKGKTAPLWLSVTYADGSTRTKGFHIAKAARHAAKDRGNAIGGEAGAFLDGGPVRFI